MKLITLLTITAAFITYFSNAHASSPLSPKRLTIEQVVQDVSLAKKAYNRIHPGYDRYTNRQDLNLAWNNIIEQAKQNNGSTVSQLYLDIQKVLTEIRCDHTKAELPKSLRQERETRPMYLPFRWKVIEDKAIVTDSHSLTGLETGDQILQIDGRNISDMIAEVMEYIPFDGSTSWSRSSGIAESLEFAGGAVDHFGALIHPVSEALELKIRKRDGTTSLINGKRAIFSEWRSMIPSGNFRNATTYRELSESIAVLKVDTFVNYRDPIDPDSVFDPIFKKINASKKQTLILDLRANGGGSSDAQRSLLSYLVDEKRALVKDMRVASIELDDLRKHLWTWDKRALKPNRLGFRKNSDNSYSLRSFLSDDYDAIKQKKNAFEGRLIILTSNANSSGSTALIAFLKEHRNALLVGEKTGGSAEGATAGLLFTLTLPNSNIKTRVPFFRYYNNVSQFESGLGVSPDILVRETVESFWNGEDPVLETAISEALKITAD